MSRTTTTAKATPTPPGPTPAADPAHENAATPRNPGRGSARAGAWSELLRLPVLLAVSGSTLVGAVAGRPVPGDDVASRTPRPRSVPAPMSRPLGR